MTIHLKPYIWQVLVVLCAGGWLCLLSGQAILASALPLYPHELSQPKYELIRRAAGDCYIAAGNPDLYGLGIRLGAYFALVTTHIQNILIPEASSDSWDTNGIFLIATFIAVAKNAANKTLAPAESIIMLQMLFGFLLAVWSTRKGVIYLLFYGLDVAFSHAGPSAWMHDLMKARTETSRMGSFWRLIVATGVASYSVYFWFSGVEAGACQSYVFFFTKFSATHSPVRKLYAFGSVYYLVLKFRTAILEILGGHAVGVNLTAKKPVDQGFWYVLYGQYLELWRPFGSGITENVKPLFELYVAFSKNNADNLAFVLRCMRIISQRI
jgi:hypothetical protein